MLVLAIARPPAATAAAAAAKERGTFGFLPLARNILPFTIEIKTTSPDTTGTAPASSTSQSAGQSRGQNAAQPSTAEVKLPDIPSSKLFDPFAPRTVSAELTLTGPQTEALDVATVVEGQGKTADGTALFTPKASESGFSYHAG